MTHIKRVAVHGTGRTASELMRALPHHDLELVAAIVHSPEKIGRDVGELVGLPAAGITTTGSLVDALAARPVDVVFYAGLSGPAHRRAMTVCAEAGVDQVHACFVDPRSALDPAELRELTNSARTSGTRIVGTGMIPGLWLDVLPALLASALPGPVSVHGRRVSDISSWGAETLRTEIGVGTDRSGPAHRIESLLRECGRLVADSLGLDGSDIESVGGFVLADEDTRVADIVVPRGHVQGFDQSVVLRDGGTERLRLTWSGSGATPGSGGADTDVVLTLTGWDSSELTVRVEVPADPYPGTAARMIRAARGLVDLPPGLHPPTALAVG